MGFTFFIAKRVVIEIFTVKLGVKETYIGAILGVINLVQYWILYLM